MASGNENKEASTHKTEQDENIAERHLKLTCTALLWTVNVFPVISQAPIVIGQGPSPPRGIIPAYILNGRPPPIPVNPPRVTPIRTAPSGDRRRPPPTRPPIIRIPPFFVNVGQLTRDAVAKVDNEDAIMRQRLDRNIDRYPQTFDNPDPLLFSENPENSSRFSRQSRIINWIQRLMTQRNIRMSLRSVLNHPSAASYGVFCPFIPPVHCEVHTRYRTVDGTCNNVGNPLWGSASIPFTRLLPAVYETIGDRDDFPRQSRSGGQSLPNSRVISTKFHQPERSGDDSDFSFLLTIYGQFLSHDVTDRAPTKGLNEAVLKCCDQRLRTPDGKCDNIPIPQRDLFRQLNRDCLEFPRSLEVTDLECRHGRREQLNTASSFVDGGAIYGATKNKSDSLRRFKGGRLMMSEPRQLPIHPHGNSRATMQGFAFYAAGDNRVNEFIGLIAMETVWLREHNRIAEVLERLNPSWNDEILYQETRRIIIALVQHVTYSEYLPAVLGQELMRKYDLHVLRSGRYGAYDPNQDPGLFNVFATAAMRFGHSLLRTTHTLLNIENRPNGYTPIDLKDTFFRPQTFLLHEDPLMRGMATESSKICDRVVSQSVINNLYETDVGTGSDLAANNIQRGRDHGLPSYTEWRRHYGLSVPRSFTTSSGGFSDHDSDTVRRLRSLYSKIEDMDLFTAGLSERPVPGGAVGKLFGNIIGQQFKILKKGDRFWYETDQRPQAFTDGQLAEIRKVTLSRLLCNTYTFSRIQGQAFLKPDISGNSVVPCSRIPQMDLSKWRL